MSESASVFLGPALPPAVPLAPNLLQTLPQSPLLTSMAKAAMALKLGHLPPRTTAKKKLYTRATFGPLSGGLTEISLMASLACGSMAVPAPRPQGTT
ncbi:hypothetical protein H0H87_007750 [Tephrocybe sp. NHM501043]|nr:hypothetical protein H0H87_007750 [Tephrocybe sp. NHM501043]